MAPPNPFTLALPLFIAPLITGCADPTKDAGDTDTEVVDTDTVVTDTDVEDTDVEDTDVEDTDVADTDVTDTDLPANICGDDVLAADAVCFDSPFVAPGEGAVVDITFGDWTGDGNIDIVGVRTNSIFQLAGDGVGGLGSRTTITTSGPVEPFVDIEVGQLDSATNLDLVVAGSTGAYMLFGNGEGGVAATERVNTGEGAVLDVAVANLLGTDPSEDVLISGECGGVVQTSGVEGEGVLDRAVEVCADSYVGFAKVTATYSGAVGAHETSATVWLLNTGEGIIVGEGVVATLPGNALGLTTADLDGDGFGDAAVVTDTDQIAVLFSDGAAGWASQGANDYIPYSVGEGASAIASGDIDGDGDIDLVVSVTGDDVVTVLINDGTGTFTSENITLPVGAAPARIATGDLNDDGVDDIAVSTPGTGDLNILLSNQ